MTLPTTGLLSISDLIAEFGGTLPVKLSDYYGAGGAPGSGTLRLSDFRGLSDVPSQVYAWVGRFKFNLGKDGTKYGYQTGTDLNSNPRTAFGSIVTTTNMQTSTWTAFVLDVAAPANARWNVIGRNGIFESDVAPANLDGITPNDGVKAEYYVTGGSVPNASGTLRSAVIENTGKYGTDFIFRAYEPETGPLSNLPNLAELFKYCYDNGATLELVGYADN
jgi:hypothetical protein